MRIARPATLIYRTLLALVVGGSIAFVAWRASPVAAYIGIFPAIALLWTPLRTLWRRWWWARQGLAATHREWLTDHLLFYTTLGQQAKQQFEQDVRFFMEEQVFEGVDRVAVTDVLRLGVAAGAALMLHGRPDWEFNTRRTFLLFPDRFDDDYFDTPYANFDGMVHSQGPVILSVRAIEHSWAYPEDGSNVVLHELAHLFEFAGALSAGMPSLINNTSAEAWQALVRRGMNEVRTGKSMLRPYAATNPAEFFAVAVENFFERPAMMQDKHPDLFEALVALFNLDPRWN